MSENEIIDLLSQWQMHQHCNEEAEWEKIEEILFQRAGLDMRNNWEAILKGRNLIQ